MTTIIITDCRDDNAMGRQIARATTLLPFPATLVGVSNDLEAAGNLIDVLDALDGKPAVVLVNVAPRHDEAKKWENGTPFGYFWHQETLVVASIDGHALSLVKQLKLVDAINVMDIPTALDEMVAKEFLAPELKDYIVSTQFRSFEFVPRAAAYIWQYKSIVSTPLAMTEIPDAGKAVWWVDNFGNCKTTMLASSEAQLINGAPFFLSIGQFPYYARLKDVPNGEIAVIAGSSGLGTQRFLEVVVQGGNASMDLGLISRSVIA